MYVHGLKIQAQIEFTMLILLIVRKQLDKLHIQIKVE